MFYNIYVRMRHGRTELKLDRLWCVCKDQKEAHELVDQLRKRGLDARIECEGDDGGPEKTHA
jgi:hypothetical protein